MKDLRRHLLGAAGVAFLGLAITLAVSGVGGQSGAFAISILLRAGLLLSALWLALPNIVGLYRFFPKWVWWVSAAALLVAVFQRNLILIVAVIFVVLLFFQIVAFIIRPLGSASEDTPKRSS